MVSTLTLTFIITTLILSTIVPVIFAIILYKKGYSKILVFFIGMLGFFIPQIIIRIPLLALFSTQEWYINFSSTFGYLVILALSAAVFESFGRLFVFKVCIPKSKSYQDGIMAGLGHGAIESIIWGGTASMTNLIYSLKINAGQFDTVLSQAQNDTHFQQLQNVEASLISSPSPLFLISGAERILVITIHIGLSLLLLEGINKNKTVLYMLITILIHTLLDFMAAFLSARGVELLIIEAVILIFTIASLIYIKKSKLKFPILDKEAQKIS